MLTKERKSYILGILERTGRVVAKDVSRELNLSDDTIRRDLRELAREGLLKRVHGGALPVAPANAPFAGRLGLSNPEKVAIGKYAAAMMEPGQVVFLDGGTTALEVARHAPPGADVTFITHSPNVAVELLNRGCLEIEIVGGRLFPHSIVTRGAATMDWIKRYRPDVFFLGATGIHPEAGITTGDGEEAAVKRAIMERSGSTYVMASSEKLGAVASFVIAKPGEIDGIVVATIGDDRISDLLATMPCVVQVATEVIAKD